MQLVVVMAVRKAVSAATITFTATSMTFFFMEQGTGTCSTNRQNNSAKNRESGICATKKSVRYT